MASTRRRDQRDIHKAERWRMRHRRLAARRSADLGALAPSSLTEMAYLMIIAKSDGSFRRVEEFLDALWGGATVPA